MINMELCGERFAIILFGHSILIVIWFDPQYILMFTIDSNPPLAETMIAHFYDTTTLSSKSHMSSREPIARNSPVATL